MEFNRTAAGEISASAFSAAALSGGPLPVLIDTQLRPEVLRRGDAHFDDALRFMHWLSEDFAHRFVPEGDEVVVA
jgi:hypothetical protein